MPDMTEARLVEIEDLLSRSAPGPWTIDDGSIDDAEGATIARVYSIEDYPCMDEQEEANIEGIETLLRHTGELIISAPTDIPALIAALREARAERDAVDDRRAALLSALRKCMPDMERFAERVGPSMDDQLEAVYDTIEIEEAAEAAAKGAPDA